MRTWPHSGFSVDQSVFMLAGDRAGIERLVGYMTVVAFLEPPQADVIEKILRHGGLWRSPAARPPPAHSTGDGLAFANRSDGEPQELTYVDMDTFLSTFE